jgi:uncharacterized protein (DUF342 family)
MDPVTAAKEGDLTVFALTIAGILLALAGSAIWWLIKARISDKMRKEEHLERRLNAGNTRFERLSQDLDGLKDNLVTMDKFEKYCSAHEKDHERITDSIINIGVHMERIESKLTLMTEMLAKKLSVGYVEDE